MHRSPACRSLDRSPRAALRAALLGVVAGAAAGSAPGDVALVGFDVLLDGTPIGPGMGLSTQWAEIGVVFANESGDPIGISNNRCSLSPPNHAFASTIVATFVDPCTGAPTVTSAAGTAQDFCWFPSEGIDMKAFDAEGQLVAQQFNVGGGNVVVFSFATPVIARLEMTCVLQGIDNFQFEAVVPVHPPDLDADGAVTAADLAILLGAWGACRGCCPADLNIDDDVDAADLAVLLGAWTG